MKKINTNLIKKSALAMIAIATLASNAQAASFLNTTGGLFSTGFSGGVLVDNAVDPNYSYASATGASASAAYANMASYTPNPVAVTSLNVGGTNGAATGGWVGINTSGQNSAWISVNDTAMGAFGSTQYYAYRTSFDLTGYNLNSVVISGSWASDNRGKGIYLNGVQVATIDGSGNANAGASSLTAFNLSAFTANLQQGSNTLDFLLLNGSNAETGLRVEFNAASADSLVPEPVAFLLMAIGTIGFGLVRRKSA